MDGAASMGRLNARRAPLQALVPHPPASHGTQRQPRTGVGVGVGLRQQRRRVCAGSGWQAKAAADRRVLQVRGGEGAPRRHQLPALAAAWTGSHHAAALGSTLPLTSHGGAAAAVCWAAVVLLPMGVRTAAGGGVWLQTSGSGGGSCGAPGWLRCDQR